MLLQAIFVFLSISKVIVECSQNAQAFQLQTNGKEVVVNLTDVVLKCLERLRVCMTHPHNPYTPLLDPLSFSLDKLADRETLRLNGTIDGSVSRLSRFQVRYLTVTVPSLSARLWATVPQLSLSGTINLSGTVAGSVPLFGSGPYQAVMSDLSLDVTTVLAKDPTTHFLSMTNFTVNFTPASLQVTLGGLLGGGPLGAVLQQFVQDSSLQFLDRARPLIADLLHDTVTAAANPRLSGHSLSDLIQFLRTFSNNTQTC